MERPNNWLIPAIFSTLCCCLPLGIVAIIQASKVNSLWDTNQHAAAIEAAGKARFWTFLAVGIGFVVTTLSLIAQVALGVLSASQNG